VLITDAFQPGDFVHGLDLNLGFGPSAICTAGRPECACTQGDYHGDSLNHTLHTLVQFRSNNSTCDGCLAASFTRASSDNAAASPAFSTWPFTSTSPVATCTHA